MAQREKTSYGGFQGSWRSMKKIGDPFLHTEESALRERAGD
jgi:hypothetical protein